MLVLCEKKITGRCILSFDESGLEDIGPMTTFCCRIFQNWWQIAYEKYIYSIMGYYIDLRYVDYTDLF